jgi:hypothetical protein
MIPKIYNIRYKDYVYNIDLLLKEIMIMIITIIMHYSICKKLGIETSENWYSHILKPVTEHEDVTVLWNQGIQTDREVLANRLDIIIKNKDKTCLLIDVAIPSDKNVIQKEAEKKLKYKKSKYRNSENVEHEMLCHTSNHWGHGNCEQKFTNISGNNTRTTLNRFPTKNCHIRNITRHKESATS